MNQDELKRYAASKQIALGTAEKDYVLSVVLMNLSKGEYAENLIFKGGTAIKKVYFPDARFSVDLDFDFFDVRSDNLVREISYLYGGKTILEANFREIRKEDMTDNRVLLRLEYVAQMKYLDSIRLDFTFKEPVLTTPTWWTPRDDYEVARRTTCEHLEMQIIDNLGIYDCKLGRIKRGQGRRRCLDCRMEAPRRRDPIPSAFKAMSLEEILSEKVRACLVRGRPRDLYDIWFLQSKGTKLDRDMIVYKLQLYQEFKEKIPNLREIREHLNRIKPEWNRDLAALVPSKSYPAFEETLETVINSLKNSGWKG